jgi:asparagine synthase (glutamine-hydrolysing)
MDKIFEYADFKKALPFSNYKHLKNGLIVNFYGSIFNQESLKKALKLKENIETIDLISYGYQIFGTNLFKKLDGIFSITIYDQTKQMLYLVKDRVGLQPLYFYTHNQKLIFGSSLKDFYHIPFFTKKIDKNALALYLTYGYILQPYTIFEHTHKVKAGHFVAYDFKKQSWRQKSYWTLESCYEKEKSPLKEEEVISNVEDILHHAIDKRIDSKQKIATSLSGGYDSSIVAALLSKKSAQKIDTFTIGFNEKEMNEAHHAKKIAAYLGTEHHEHYFSASDAIDIVPKLSLVYDEPFADYGATPTVLMAQLAKQSGFETLFVGDGGDEVFATADDVTQFDKLLNTPVVLKNSIYYILNSVNPLKMPILKSYQNFPTKHYKLLQLLKATKISQMVKTKPILFYDNEIKTLLKEDTTKFKTTFDEIDFPNFAESVDQVIGSYFKTSMADAELVKSFQAVRYSNLRIKEPLLDLDLIHYMAGVPGNLKIKDGEKKYILKTITHKYLPKSLLDRPKSGFDIPFSMWLKGPLKDLLYAHINEIRLESDGLFNTKSVIKIRDAFYNGNESYKYKLWTLFLFQLWYDKVLSTLNDI